MLYLCKWEGDETDWITLTPHNPNESDSQLFDEGQCTGFKMACHNSNLFISELIALMNRHQQTINLV